MSNPKFGLSVETTRPFKGPYQRLGVKALYKNGFTLSIYKGHTSVIPSGPSLEKNLKSWAATRPTLIEGLIGQERAHPYTKLLIRTKR